MWFDVSNLDVGVSPWRYQEYDRDGATQMHNVRYDTADHGNGMRLLVGRDVDPTPHRVSQIASPEGQYLPWRVLCQPWMKHMDGAKLQISRFKPSSKA